MVPSSRAAHPHDVRIDAAGPIPRHLKSTVPSSVSSRFGGLPLREFPHLRSAGSCLS